MLRRLLIVIFALSAGSQNLRAEDSLKDKTLDLYLLIGQSNMAGRGKVSKIDKTPHPRVFVLNQAGKWAPAVEPLHFDKPIAGVGPGLAFGKMMADADKSVVIGLIPCAAGGSPITVWKKGAIWNQTRSKPYDDTLKRLAVARKKGVLKGILWHQGESDSKPEASQLYAERLAEFVKRLRRDINAADVPFLVGGMSDPFVARNKHAKLVDQALRNLPEKVSHTDYVSAEKLELKRDNVHFSATAEREFGRRYARAMMKLQSKDQE